MLTNLYNSVHPSFGKMRYSVFLSLLDYCVATSQIDKVAKHLNGLEARLSAWNLSVPEQKEFYLKLATALKVTRGARVPEAAHPRRHRGRWAPRR